MSRFGYDGSHILWGRFWYIVSNTTDIMSSCTGEENPGETTTALASGRYSGLPRHRESIDTLFKKGMGGRVLFWLPSRRRSWKGIACFPLFRWTQKRTIAFACGCEEGASRASGPTESALFHIASQTAFFFSFYFPRFGHGMWTSVWKMTGLPPFEKNSGPMMGPGYLLCFAESLRELWILFIIIPVASFLYIPTTPQTNTIRKLRRKNCWPVGLACCFV